MGFSIFPHRSAEERASKTKFAVETCASFGATTLGDGLFL